MPCESPQPFDRDDSHEISHFIWPEDEERYQKIVIQICCCDDWHIKGWLGWLTQSVLMKKKSETKKKKEEKKKEEKKKQQQKS